MHSSVDRVDRVVRSGCQTAPLRRDIACTLRAREILLRGAPEALVNMRFGLLESLRKMLRADRAASDRTSGPRVRDRGPDGTPVAARRPAAPGAHEKKYIHTHMSLTTYDKNREAPEGATAPVSETESDTRSLPRVCGLCALTAT